MALKVAVIGAGPAGYPAALSAARLGAEVTVFEKDLLGGVCLNSGCIPSKSLLDAAHRFDAVRDIARFCEDGAQTQAQALLGQISWPKIQARQQAVTRKLTGGIGVLFKQAKISVVPAAAAFKDAHTLTAQTAEGAKEFTFDYIIIAAGTEAFVPPPFDKIRDKIYDNSNIFQIPRLPQKLAIVGGGVIGCEFATLMSSLNVEVSVVEMQPRLLPNMEVPMVLVRCAMSLAGVWVDCPSVHKDQIYPVPEVQPGQENLDYVPWPLPRMDWKTRLKLAGDQLRILKL